MYKNKCHILKIWHLFLYIVEKPTVMSSARQEYFPPLLENQFYHIYNRGNNGDNIFFQLQNYRYFLEKYDSYLSDYLETYAYCLLPNHFHLLVRIKDFSELPESLREMKHGSKTYSLSEQIISEKFRRFFISYAKSIKVQETRTGSLFEKNFRRKHVDSDAYFTNLIAYIHRNPQTHGICAGYADYPYSSYGRILMPRPTKLMKTPVLDWFDGPDQYQKFHADRPDTKLINHLLIED